MKKQQATCGFAIVELTQAIYQRALPILANVSTAHLQVSDEPNAQNYCH